MPLKKRQVFKWLTGTVLVILVLLSVLLTLLLSPWGTRLGVNIADSMFDELRIDYKSGGLASQIQLSRLSWQQADASVVVHDIGLEFSLECLWTLSVCIEQLSTGNIDVAINAQNNETEPATASDKITLPFVLNIADLRLGRLNLLIEDQLQVSWQSLVSRLQYYQRIDVAQLDVTDLAINLLAKTETSQTASQDVDWAHWQYQPLSPVEIKLPVALNLKQVKISPLTVMIDGESAQVIDSLLMEVSANPEQINLSQLIVKHNVGELTATAELKLDGIFTHQLNLNTKVNSQEVGQFDAVVNSQGDINKLNAQLHSTGMVKADVTFETQLSSAKLPLDLTLSWQQLRWPSDSSANNNLLQSPQGQFSIKGDLDGMQITAQSEVSGDSIPRTTIDLDATASRKGINLKKLLALTLGGQVLTSGSVSFEDSLKVLANMRLEHINPGVFDPDYHADVSGQLDIALANQHGQWQGALQNLDLHGTWRAFPLQAQGKVEFDGAANINVDNLQIKNGDNSVAGVGQLSSDRKLDFELQIEAPNLAQSIADVQGSISAKAQVTGTVEQPQLSYTLAGQQLSFADIMIKKVQGSGSVIWNDIKPLNIELELQQIEGINNQIDEAKLRLSGNAAAHQLVLDTTSNKTNLQAKITGVLSDNSWHGRWLEGQIESSYASLSLREPFDIVANWQDDNYSISAHCWQQDSSDLCIKQAEFKQQYAKWDIELHDLNLLPLLHRLVPDFTPLDSASLLSMTLQGDWLMDQLPQTQLHAELSPAVWTFKDQQRKSQSRSKGQQNLSLDLQTFKLDAQFSAQDVNLQAELSGPEIGAMKIALKGEPGVFADQLTRPIEGEFSLNHFNLAPFRIMLPGLDKFEGMLAGTTKVSGTLQQPLFNGKITLSDGALQGEGIPLIVNGVNQEIELLGDKAQITGSYLLGKGLGDIKGDIAWQPQLKGQIHINGEALEFDYQSMLRAQVSPNVDIQFSTAGVNVSGEVTVPYARFKLRELPPDSISPSKDVVLVEQQAEVEQAESILDIELIVLIDPKERGQVKLDAFGLTTDVRGKIRLENNQRGMSAAGAMQLVNGRYKAYGQNLLIRQGDITFNGPLDRPFLSIEAIRDPKLTANETVAGIRVEGAADNPKVEVFSEPTMELQQSLSYLLTGRAFNEPSGDSQDTMLTNMLLGFGLGQTENMISNIGQKLGFKDVNLDTSGQGDNTQLSLTGYVLPGVQLRYGVGVFDSVSEVAIRYELLPQLYIEAVSGVASAIDIYYHFTVEGSDNKKVQSEKQ
jgi:translocation and assembly module TamB